MPASPTSLPAPRPPPALPPGAAIRDAFVAASPELKWCQTSRRGYMTLRVTPEVIRSDWTFLDTILSPSLAVHSTSSAHVRRGQRRLQLA